MLRAMVFIALEPNRPLAPELVAVELAYRFIEDGRGGSECATTVRAPDGFVRDGTTPNVFVGPLSADTVQFQVTTESYSSEWTGRLSVGARVVTDTELRK